jgi:hypothetical protein
MNRAWGLATLLRRFSWMLPGLVLFLVALSAPACTWVEVTLHSTPTQPSAPIPSASGASASPTAPPTETQPTAPPTADAFPTGPAATLRPTPTPGLRAQLDTLEEQVIALRGLHPTARIPRLMMKSDSIRRLQLAEALGTSTRTEIAAVLAALRLLGLTEPELDLSRYLELGLESIPSWAYYQRRTGRILLPEPSHLTLDQRLSYIGAYTLALLDQHFSLGDGPVGRSGISMLREDSALALGALLFGDQALVQSQWLRIYAQEPDSGADRLPFGAL